MSLPNAKPRALGRVACGLAMLAATAATAKDEDSNAGRCERVVHADVMALDQCLVYNRYGTVMPDGMIFALRRDVVASDPHAKDPRVLAAGQVRLRDGKRPRPIVLRANEGDCLEICFTNLLSPSPVNPNVPTRTAGLHVQGLEVVDRLEDDGTWVGLNANGQAAPAETPSAACQPGESKTYRLFARKEGVFLLYSDAGPFGTSQFPGNSQIFHGLFGVVIVEPKGSSWYRSQVTEEALRAASRPGETGQHGHPIIDFDKLDAEGVPILAMAKQRANAPEGPPVFDLYHSDLTAIIAGPDVTGSDRWLFPPDKQQDDNPVYPDRRRPFREFAILYHDAFNLNPAFDFGNNTAMNYQGGTVGNEIFAINYGAVAIGTEVWANRIGVGPAKDSVEAKFEEFFLSSWTGGDPALIVDIPANTPKSSPAGAEGCCPSDKPTPVDQLARKPATKVFYPDDPSNVFHSYLNDRVKFRVLHAGTDVVHVHHLHAHQWLETPASSESKLLDSQTITPGDGFTLEMIYGSGNRNLTAGDAIFHCHFYPHFAGGLWAMWRNHDVFEAGTPLVDGRPAPGSRALPDGEIAAGTPIPAVVPMPTLPMAPMPAAVKLVPAQAPAEGGQPATVGQQAVLVDPERDKGKNPGFPFFIPGLGGQRAPQPPFDFAIDEETSEPLDGGLPRHLVLGGTVVYEQHNSYDFTKENVTIVDGKATEGFLTAKELPADGTPLEQAAMAYHEQHLHPTDRPDGSPGIFLTNGGKRRPGAPYADPSIDPRPRPKRPEATPEATAMALEEEYRNPPGKETIRYKAADVQLDVVFNKSGWHYPQQRIATLWGDVKDVLSGVRAPEPLIFRANSANLIEYWFTNLVPGYYELDDFQVRTPTDMIGQHIHLVKFDVTSSDGAANGFNYQDGSFSPEEVRNRIAAINAANGLYSDDLSRQRMLQPTETPFFGAGPDGAWVGAQTTIQLWYADRLLDREPPKPLKKPGYRESGGRPEDRTLQTVFTHDHFAPTTHQQVGLYAGMVIEPEGTHWYDTRTGERMGQRLASAYAPGGPPTRDGGPTSWQALIISEKPERKDQAFREFVLEFQDFQLAYTASSIPKAIPYKRYPHVDGTPDHTWGWMDPANAIAAPNGPKLPTLVSNPPEPGGRSLNYRSEPIPFRVGVNTSISAPPGEKQDLSHAFRSIERENAALNGQPKGPLAPGSPFLYPGPFEGAGPYDPYTPLLRAYENDRVQLRTLVGGYHDGHVFTFHGLNWLAEPSWLDSGYRSTQTMSISEHFEMHLIVPVTGAPQVSQPPADYLYMASADTDGVAQGLWGLMRAYRDPVEDLAPLPSNPPGNQKRIAEEIAAFYRNDGPDRRPVREYDVTATSLKQLLPDQPNGLVYYQRGNQTVIDPHALVYVRSEDLDGNGQLKKDAPPLEPLVLRANAGDLIQVTLRNRFNPKEMVFTTPLPFQGAPLAFSNAVDGQVGVTSTSVGLHPELLALDINRSSGFNAGNNPVQTAAPGQDVTYTWYAGTLEFGNGGSLVATPVEFGSVNLLPSDPSFQHPHGMVGALVVEPRGSEWSKDARTAAIVRPSKPDDNGAFQEFVLVMQDGVANSVVIEGNAPVSQGYRSLNYKNDNMFSRFGLSPSANFTMDLGASASDTLVPGPATSGSVGPVGADPQTPILVATAGAPVRVRVVHTAGNDYADWTIHGHTWQRNPRRTGSESTVLGHSRLSEWIGNIGPNGPLETFDALIDRAGGRFGIPGDYLVRAVVSGDYQSGQWGLLRVLPPGQDSVSLRTLELASGRTLSVQGAVLRAVGEEKLADEVQLQNHGQTTARAKVDPRTGAFAMTAEVDPSNASLRVVSSGGGSAPIGFQGSKAETALIAPRPSVAPVRIERRPRFIRRGPTLR